MQQPTIEIGPFIIIFLSPIIIAAVMIVHFLVKVIKKDRNLYYAGFWLRVLAQILDGVFLSIIGYLVGGALGFFLGYNMAGSATLSEFHETAAVVGTVVGLVCFWLYNAVMESSKYQATIGKKMIGLRVVGLDGERVSFARASGRHLSQLVCLLTFYIGYLLAGWTKRKQGLHDKMSGCLVVRANYVAPSYEESTDAAHLAVQPKVIQTKTCPFCAEEIMASAIKCKHCSEMLSSQFEAAPVIENIPSSVVSNFNEQPENKEKFDATDLLEAKKLENRFFSAITSSEAQIEAEKQDQITPLKSQRSQLPWRDILGAAILLGCLVTFAWAANSLLQFFS
ncbi:RDD family protein [Rhodobacteraceae bacterium]|nr:RDD family protein [Paracoccaceae bacterium]